MTVFFQKSRTFNYCTCFATFGKSSNKTDKSDIVGVLPTMFKYGQSQPFSMRKSGNQFGT
ncbi:hypothetical protein ECW26_38010 [Escherichia coli W26]|nr:hypothetical protein ECW26_38010 [Escherichia coli W26]